MTKTAGVSVSRFAPIVCFTWRFILLRGLGPDWACEHAHRSDRPTVQAAFGSAGGLPTNTPSAPSKFNRVCA